jgi:DNA-binding transcriptional ArsR family regulator
MEIRRDVFQAIADPTRRAIINLIAHQSLNLNTIAKNFDVSRPAISQHIKVLVECGVIIIHRQGRERYCEAQLGKLGEVAAWVEPYKKFWSRRMDRLDSLLGELQTKGKTKRKKK